MNEFEIKMLISFYIPIWLDLLLYYKIKTRGKNNVLHSNMVRFIIDLFDIKANEIINFTFQYG